MALHCAPRDLIGDGPEATSPEMIATLINYLNWRNEKIEAAQKAQRRRRGTGGAFSA